MEQEAIITSAKPAKPKSRSSVKKEETFNFSDIDPKRLSVGIVIIVLIFGAFGFWAKNNLPRFLAGQEQKLEEAPDLQGLVAGETDVNLDGLREQVDAIKKDVKEIKVEDVKEQEAVKKILNDLDGLVKKASDSAKIFNVKGNLCEEIKKRFCE